MLFLSLLITQSISQPELVTSVSQQQQLQDDDKRYILSISIILVYTRTVLVV